MPTLKDLMAVALVAKDAPNGPTFRALTKREVKRLQVQIAKRIAEILIARARRSS